MARQLSTATEWIEDFLAEIAGEVFPDQPDRSAYQPTLSLHRRRALTGADAILDEAGSIVAIWSFENICSHFRATRAIRIT
ncbi:MAG: hypothetical protein KAV00_07755 [Phycisphaerae bacterium]|nr:hypothetical protein [Phycisphaerae bacterium]